ncbi:hypothetical protein SBRCBS47491_004951 [Sporothrix bragantina]|uniref:Major facilitator superfamily (MFS) profile domain-containing protein n=1 Tax=Sporothrix bragantina TaxID=671064 RepID=A0ABP0BT80_9PEZI
MPSFRQFIIYLSLLGCGSLIGYESTYLNGVLSSPDFVERYGVYDAADGWYLTPAIRSLFTSMMMIGTLFGASATAYMPLRFGCRGVFAIAAAFMAVGIILQMISVGGPAVFIVGRILEGYTLGVISVYVPAYLTESVRPAIRGRMIASWEQVATFGNVTANIINYGTSFAKGPPSWRVTIGFQCLHVVFLFMAATLAPESPVMLVKQGKPQEASKSLAVLRNTDANADGIVTEMRDIKSSLALDEPVTLRSYLECFKGNNLRRQVIGIVMSIFGVYVGIGFFLAYGTSFFKAAGVNDAYLVSLILAIVMSTFTLPALYTMDRFGRRKLLLFSAVLQALFMLLAGIVHSTKSASSVANNALIAFSVLFIATYAGTWGPVSWCTMTELWSWRLRNQHMNISLLSYWIFNWILGFVLPYIIDPTAGNLGINVTYIFGGINVLAFFWVFFCFPDVTGLSFAEVDQLFAEKVPARHSIAWGRARRVLNAETVIESTESIDQKQTVQETKIDV